MSDNHNRTRCLVCGGDLGPAKIPGLFQCRSCGFKTANLELSHAQLKELYGRDYFHGAEYLDYEAEEQALKQNFLPRIETLKKFIPDSKSLVLFEIGCAYGYFLDLARHGFKEVSGIDVAEDAVSSAGKKFGLDVFAGDYLRHDLQKPADVICLWDVLEHLEHPDRFMEKAAKDLAPGGTLALTTVDIGSLTARVRGKNWRMIHPPTHLHYFDVSTLSRLVENAGFEVVHIEHPGLYRPIIRILHGILDIRWGIPKLFKFMENFKFLNRSIYLNLFDIVYVIARKR